ncbi:MAG: hypothetical protein H7A23_24200 [Leptospiraceae bacterium]|nr:hypothetical protein [Leptospiraceae bacterium]
MVENLNAQLEQIESSRKQKLGELEERLTSHLFVTANEAEPLKVGLAKAEIEIKNWKSKLDELQKSYQ